MTSGQICGVAENCVTLALTHLAEHSVERAVQTLEACFPDMPGATQWLILNGAHVTYSDDGNSIAALTPAPMDPAAKEALLVLSNLDRRIAALRGHHA